LKFVDKVERSRHADQLPKHDLPGFGFWRAPRRLR
jgi:hypothetical protein